MSGAVSIAGTIGGFALGWYELAPRLGFAAGGASGDVARFIIALGFTPQVASAAVDAYKGNMKMVVNHLLGLAASFGMMWLLAGYINSMIPTDWLAAIVLSLSAGLAWWAIIMLVVGMSLDGTSY